VRGRYQVFHPDPEVSQAAAKSLHEGARSLLHLRPTAPVSLTPLSNNP
jgi:hypothetical protein